MDLLFTSSLYRECVKSQEIFQQKDGIIFKTDSDAYEAGY